MCVLVCFALLSRNTWSSLTLLKQIYVAHSFGDSRARCQPWLNSSVDLVVDVITMVAVCVGGIDHIAKQKSREQLRGYVSSVEKLQLR
jgi:hypothetical protein